VHPGTHYLGVDGEVIKKFDPMPPPYPLGWVPTATFVQPVFERALREKAAQFKNCDVRLSTKVIDIEQDDEGVVLTTGGVIRARYAVACDGANSFVRKALGIGLEDLAFDEWWMVVDAFEKNAAGRPAKCFQYCRPSRPGTFLPGPGALRRWEIKLLPGETPEEFGVPDNVLAVLNEFTDVSRIDIWRSAVYRFHALLGETWHAGRIFLMGDAVHQTPPFLGQGLCAGIRDASNLSWKLAMVLDGSAQPSLLDSYEIERKPHVRAVVATAKEFGKIIGELDLDVAKTRDRRLRAELAQGTAETVRQKFIPDLKDGMIAGGGSMAGTLFPQPHVRGLGGAVSRLDDVVPPGFTIFAATADAMDGLSPALISEWKAIGGNRVVVTPDGVPAASRGVLHLQETDRLFNNWLSANDLNAAVVRPDHYIYGGAATADELNALVAELTSRLGVRVNA
jgi:3-(3-hydroxy-phenyl)propionate hydroxylase